MTKSKWVPKVGDRVSAYRGLDRFVGIIETIFIDGGYRLKDIPYYFRRYQLRRLVKKPKRDKIMAWANVYKDGKVEIWSTKEKADMFKADDCADLDRIRCVRLEEAEDA